MSVARLEDHEQPGGGLCGAASGGRDLLIPMVDMRALWS
jgi:hypothetical protein